MLQEKVKRNIKSVSFIIVFYCSMVTIGKNTKKKKRKKTVKDIHLCDKPYKSVSEKILEIIFIWYFNLTDKLVT